MAFKKVATLDVKSVYATDSNGVFDWRSFVKQANEEPSKAMELPVTAYKYDTDHFVYITARMISGMERWGHNGNYDAFPWEEIKKAMNTAVGKGFYIEHKEDSDEDAKGIILDVFPNNEEEYLTALCAISKDQYPEFCKQLINGIYNQVSMSCLAEECECSLCHNVAHTFDQLCEHMNSNMPITFMKGKVDEYGNDIYEINRNLSFTGLSAVEVPADKDAFIFDIKASKKKENTVQQEFLKYTAIKKASKMKELKTACEEEFNKLDKYQLLNRMESVLVDINSNAVFRNENLLLDDKLSDILEQMIQLQVGLNLLNLSEVQQNNPPVIEKEVIVEEKPYESIIAKMGSKYSYNLILKTPNKWIIQVKYGDKVVDEQLFSGTEEEAHYQGKKNVDYFEVYHKPTEEVNLDREIDSYLSGDNESYTPFSSTASKISFEKKAGTWAIPDTVEKAIKLKSLMQTPLDSKTAEDVLSGIVGDDKLFDKIDKTVDRDPKADVRQFVKECLIQWVKQPVSDFKFDDKKEFLKARKIWKDIINMPFDSKASFTKDIIAALQEYSK